MMEAVGRCKPSGVESPEERQFEISLFVSLKHRLNADDIGLTQICATQQPPSGLLRRSPFTKCDVIRKPYGQSLSSCLGFGR